MEGGVPQCASATITQAQIRAFRYTIYAASSKTNSGPPITFFWAATVIIDDFKYCCCHGCHLLASETKT